MSHISAVYVDATTEFNPSVKRLPKEVAMVEISADPVPPTWDQRAIKVLNSAEDWLDTFMPNGPYQDRLDQMGALIEKKLGKLDGFNKWLDDTGKGHLIWRMACMLAKMPLRIARNVVRLLYQAIKCLAYGMTHPAKAIVQLGKIGVLLAKSLTKSETWYKMGWGMMGAGLGNAAVTLNPFALILSGAGFLALMIGLLMDDKRFHIENVQKGMDAFFTGLAAGATFGAVYSPPSYSLEDFIRWYSSENHHNIRYENIAPDGNVYYMCDDGYWYIPETQEHLIRFENYLTVCESPALIIQSGVASGSSNL